MRHHQMDLFTGPAGHPEKYPKAAPPTTGRLGVKQPRTLTRLPPTSRKRAKQQSDGTRPSPSRFFTQGDTTHGRPSERRTGASMTLNQDAKRRPSLDPCGPNERCHGTPRKRTLNSAYRQAIYTPCFMLLRGSTPQEQELKRAANYKIYNFRPLS